MRPIGMWRSSSRPQGILFDSKWNGFPHARAGVNVDGCRRFESGVKKRYESCFRPLHLFLVTEKKKKICVEGVKKNRPQTEKTAAFKAAGSDQFHIGPCTLTLARVQTAGHA